MLSNIRRLTGGFSWGFSWGFSRGFFGGFLFSLAVFIAASFFFISSASAAKFGISLGHRFEPSRIAVDLLFPLHRGEGHRPRGGVIQAGLHILGGDRQHSNYGFDWLGLVVPVAYEHVFSKGISIIGGAEFLYLRSNSLGNNSITRKDLGGGLVIGTNYYFTSGVFLGFRTSAGITYVKNIYDDGSRGTGIAGYVDPTISVGYMF